MREMKRYDVAHYRLPIAFLLQQSEEEVMMMRRQEIDVDDDEDHDDEHQREGEDDGHDDEDHDNEHQREGEDDGHAIRKVIKIGDNHIIDKVLVHGIVIQSREEEEDHQQQAESDLEEDFLIDDGTGIIGVSLTNHQLPLPRPKRGQMLDVIGLIVEGGRRGRCISAEQIYLPTDPNVEIMRMLEMVQLGQQLYLTPRKRGAKPTSSSSSSSSSSTVAAAVSALTPPPPRPHQQHQPTAAASSSSTILPTPSLPPSSSAPAAVAGEASDATIEAITNLIQSKHEGTRLLDIAAIVPSSNQLALALERLQMDGVIYCGPHGCYFPL